MNDIRLICFDLDGTFLDDKKNIPPENLRALELAAARGVLIVPATGRIYTGVPEQLRRLPFMRWYITVNGAYVYDAVEDRAAARAEVPLDLALRFYEYCDGLDCFYDCYQDNWGFMTADMLAVAAERIPDPGIRRLIVNLRTPVPELKAYLRDKGEPVQKLQLYFEDMALRAEQLRELPRRFPELSVSSSVPFNIEINAGNATKGRALLTLCGLLGIDPGETMAFGDGTNDLDMIQKAGLGVSMANGDPALLAAADYITATNNEAGFAQAVERFVLDTPQTRLFGEHKER